MLKPIAAAFLLVLLASVAASEDVQGVADVKLRFNGEEVSGIKTATLKVGDKFEIAADITLKRDRNISVALSSSGFKSNEPQPYEMVNGEWRARAWGKKAGDSVEFRWALKPTGVWAGGSAPINIDFTFRDPITLKAETLARTIANIYIEPSSGAPAPNPPAGTPRQPGFESSTALLSLLVILLISRVTSSSER